MKPEQLDKGKELDSQIKAREEQLLLWQHATSFVNNSVNVFIKYESASVREVNRSMVTRPHTFTALRAVMIAELEADLMELRAEFDAL